MFFKCKNLPAPAEPGSLYSKGILTDETSSPTDLRHSSECERFGSPLSFVMTKSDVELLGRIEADGQSELEGGRDLETS